MNEEIKYVDDDNPDCEQLFDTCAIREINPLVGDEIDHYLSKQKRFKDVRTFADFTVFTIWLTEKSCRGYSIVSATKCKDYKIPVYEIFWNKK